MHGGESSNAFSDAELATWAERIAGYVARGVDTYAYLNNDPHGDAVRDAERLRALLDGSPTISSNAVHQWSV
jgi:uncharacterized protein YecE (DUF72 family)